jgi:putative transposase
LKQPLYSYLRIAIQDQGAKLLNINGMEDHLHLLIAIPPTITISSLLEAVKPASTKWIQKTFNQKGFSWQTGFGAFSVGKSNLQRVINYINNQEKHHQKITFEHHIIREARDFVRQEIHFWLMPTKSTSNVCGNREGCAITMGTWKSGRVAECVCLENRRPLTGSVGSNPTSSDLFMPSKAFSTTVNEFDCCAGILLT